MSFTLQTNKWKGSGPLDVANKSLYGRCEEWQILLVSIARTLGLPARPASTPWWAHQDDNHAWAEFLLMVAGVLMEIIFPNRAGLQVLAIK